MRSEDQRRNESQPRIITSYQHAQAPHSVRIVPALLPPRSSYPENRVGEGADDASDEDNDSFPSDWDDLDRSKEELLAKSLSFDIAYDADRGFRGTELKFCSFSRPHMRAFHASWVCFFTSFFVQFSAAPLLHDIQKSLKLSKADVWWSNLWFQIGGIPARFLLGPLCDKYGARATMTVLLGLAAIPSALTGLLSTNLMTLTVMRTAVGAMDTFVPCQYWIVSFFVREVGGTAMAIAGGLGASGCTCHDWKVLRGGLVCFPSHSYLCVCHCQRV
jgi:Major Facilitator Superfamily